MNFRYGRLLKGRTLLLLITSLLVLSVIVMFGCTGARSIPRGWSGGVVNDGTLFLGSMEGKLVALDVSSHTRRWNDFAFELPRTSGGFGCAPSATSVALYGTPAVWDDLVYIGGYDGKVYAINADTGVLRWVYPRQGNLEPIVGGVVVALDRVYFGSSDSKVYALDAETGDFIWEYPTGDKIWSSPVIEDGVLYIGSFDKKLHALDAISGSKKWEPFETEGVIVSSPIIDNGTIYFGSFDRNIYAVNASDGSLKWRSGVEAENWFWNRPVISGDVVYASSLDGKVYGLNVQNGDKVAEFDIGSPISSSLVLVDNSVIVASEAGQIYSLDMGSNQKRQLADLGEGIYASLIAVDGVIYVHSDKDVVYAIDSQSGMTLWSLSLKS